MLMQLAPLVCQANALTIPRKACVGLLAKLRHSNSGEDAARLGEAFGEIDIVHAHALHRGAQHLCLARDDKRSCLTDVPAPIGHH